MTFFADSAPCFTKRRCTCGAISERLFFSLIMPLLQMLLLGYGIDTNIRQINTVVFNADGRRESRELIDRLKNSDTFHVVRYVNERPGHERHDHRRKSPRGHQDSRGLLRQVAAPDERRRCWC